MLQIEKYITELLNVCYICINTLDIIWKKNKMVVSKKGKFMRIIGGKARGTKLYTLEGDNTRPTLDRVKESLFNIIQFDVPNSVFVDLFSGSGAVGLEAISRGAKKSIFCDKSRDAINIIKKNIDKIHCKEQTDVYQISYEELLQNKINEKIDIIYIDPPYETNFAYKSINIILERNLIDNDSIIIVETDREDVIKQIDTIELIEIADKRKYGRAYLIFCKKKI